jgi:hypothetical protein
MNKLLKKAETCLLKFSKEIHSKGDNQVDAMLSDIVIALELFIPKLEDRE